jgi:hypothetical protein
MNQPERKIITTPYYGTETTLLYHRRGEVQGRTVLKRFEKSFGSNDGFDQDDAKILQEHYISLQARYADLKLIPRQWIIRVGQDQELYQLAQQQLHLAKPGDIFDYTPDQLPLQTKREVETLIDLLKENYEHYQDYDSTDEYTPLDLQGKENLVVDQAGKLYYLDTGLRFTQFEEKDLEYIIKKYMAPIALLEYFTTGDIAHVCEEAWYHKLYCCVRNELGKKDRNDQSILDLLDNYKE